MTGGLQILDNDALVTMAGFPPSMTSVRNLYIRENANLTAMPSVYPPIVDNLEVTNNPKLPACLLGPYRSATTNPTLIQSGNDNIATCN